MRFEDERYVRLYTRDTITWLMLSWQGRCVAPLILRKVDRAGLLDLGDHGMDGLAATLQVPADVAREGLQSMIDKGVVTMRGSTVVWPRFIEGQDTPQSDRARQKAAREKARDIAAADETVTNRDDASQNVTERHAASRGVTPICAVPICAEREKEYIVDSSPEPTQEPLALNVEHMAPPEDAVWAHWLDGWRTRIGGGRPPEFSPKRRGMARARLESYSPEDLTRAIHALWASDWHVSEGHYAFELVMRNDEQVDKFLARCDSGSVFELRTVLPPFPTQKSILPPAKAQQTASTPVVATEDEAWAAIDLFESTRIVVG